VDIFGETSLMAEVEVLTMGIETMKAFGADESMFQVYVNHRHHIDTFLSQYSDDTQGLVRLLDKWNKLSAEDMKQALLDLGIDEQGTEAIFGFMNAQSVEEVAKLFPTLTELESFTDLQKILEIMSSLGYEKYFKFTPSLMRGFDYYDGMVFEVFDLHPDNNRAMFG
jgi:histidyl-tRNA synthetase